MTPDATRLAPRCTFHIRQQTGPAYSYQQVHLASPGGYAGYPLLSPPAPGDLVWLHDRITQAFGYYRVITRSWTVPDYGSTQWPKTEDYPKAGPGLDIIVEPTNDTPYPTEPPAAPPAQASDTNHEAPGPGTGSR